MTITLIRHSKTTLQPDVPNPLWQLSKEGISLANELASSSAIKSIDVIYCSLQTKALQTTVLLCKDNHIPIKTDKDLTELTSITNGFIEDYEDTMKRFYSGELERINGGETIVEGKARFNQAIESIVKIEGDKGNVGIVAHGNILAIFSSQFAEKSIYSIHNNIKMPDVAVLDWDSKSFIHFFGDSI